MNKDKIIVDILKFDQVNLNGRIYTKECVKESIEQLNNKCNEGKILGQMEFPDNFDISLTNASHKVHKVYIDDEDNTAKAEILFLDISTGKHLKEMYDMGGIVFRTRSAGTVDSSGYVSIQELFSVDAILKENDSFKGIL